MKWNKETIQRLGPLLGLLLIGIILSILEPRFLTVSNLFNVVRQVSINAILAFGMTFVILTGGIDLSVGSILALVGALVAGMMTGGIDPVLAVIAGIGVGAILGGINGVLVAKGKLAPFIVTLATMTIYRGLTLVYTEGRPITGLPDEFRFLGRGELLGIPVPIILTFLLFILLLIVMEKTTFGRRVYALGGNEEAARLSGIKTNRSKIWVYVISGMTAAVSAIILTSRLNSAQPTAGFAFELDAIAAVVLGGTSLAGGYGTLGGTLIGALIIGILDNGLNLLNVSSFYQQVVKGLVILIAVLLDRRKST
ncbi:ribose ABC transporter permease [Microaerobacter geothermalis]|uniref:ABC transporter permease n=1 Tax=Microaerobacter geothermalis TaxID=674972 RepID=UPI001F1D06B3|nr:ribose ABC transporter permease [Microaerobacter geothermalis]MCF6093786.1 ribose ABC transporter permease [Microaerobacter geothermalis]